MTYATSIPTTVLGMLVEPLQALLMPLAFPQTTVVGTDIPTKLVGTVYFDKSCLEPLQDFGSPLPEG